MAPLRIEVRSVSTRNMFFFHVGCVSKSCYIVHCGIFIHWRHHDNSDNSKSFSYKEHELRPRFSCCCLHS